MASLLTIGAAAGMLGIVMGWIGHRLFAGGSAAKSTKAEQGTAQSQMADFAQAANDWFWEADAIGHLTYVSPSIEAANGLSAARLVGAFRLDLDRTLDPDNPAWDAHLKAVAEKEPFRDFVMAVRLERGIKHLSFSGKPFSDAQGRHLGYRGATRDVTRDMEVQQLLALRKEELLLTTEKLRLAESARSQFITNMSHELRTPLNAILGFSEIMHTAQIGPVDQRYRDYAHDIHVSAQQLLSVINDVISISKMAADQPLYENSLDLAELIDDCRRLFRQKADEKQITLTAEIPLELPQVLVDRLRLKQALANVISNAVKFTNRGGEISLSVERPAGGGIMLIVSDTGVGMSAENIPLALEPFRQLDPSLARRYDGAGLGLPIAKSFIELHGGRIDIASALGRGTTVRIWLPPERLLEPWQAETSLASAVSGGSAVGS